MTQLDGKLGEQFAKGTRLEKEISANLRGLGYEDEWTQARLGSLVRFVSDKSLAKAANIQTYISTENPETFRIVVTWA